MELSELTAYAEEKFNIHEQHKWADFPGFSVLADPNTGKWVALLMRQWDYETGDGNPALRHQMRRADACRDAEALPLRAISHEGAEMGGRALRRRNG